MRAIVAFTLLALIAPTAAGAVVLPNGAKPLPAAELKAIYAGKTMTLGRGHRTYFAADGKMLAAQQNGNGIATAGTWTASNNGRVCYEAPFSSAADLALKTPPTRVVQCWDHQLQATGVLFWRDVGDGASLPADLTSTGDWSVFRSAPPRPTDPINQLAAGDTVSAVIQAVVANAAKPPGNSAEYGTRLDGAAIRALLSGHITRSTQIPGLAPNTTRRISLDAAGKAFIETGVARGNRTRVTGTASIRGDYFCLLAPRTQPERCFFVYKSGDNAYAFVYPDLTLNSMFEIEQAALS